MSNQFESRPQPTCEPIAEHECRETTRREFLQESISAAGAMAFGGSLLAGSAGESVASAQSKPKRPNLVFFLGEGQRSDALSIAGNPILKTPNHDRIGREGVMFRECFLHQCSVRAGACHPADRTVFALFRRTLKRAPQHASALRHSASLPTFSAKPDMKSEFLSVRSTFTTVSKNATGITILATMTRATTMPIRSLRRGASGQVGKQQQFKNVYPDDLAVDRALSWLESDRGDKPFCLLVWFVAPHEPFFRARRHLDFVSRHGDSKACDF